MAKRFQRWENHLKRHECNFLHQKEITFFAALVEMETVFQIYFRNCPWRMVVNFTDLFFPVIFTP